MTIDRALPRTSDNLLLTGSSEGTRVQLQGIEKSFGGTRVLHGVDLDIAPGEFVSLLGPSGCGKTTALRVLAGLETADGGAVLLGGRDVSRVPTNRRDIGMVFQSYSLFPHLSVADNTAFGLRRRGVRRAPAATRAADALEFLLLQHAQHFRLRRKAHVADFIEKKRAFVRQLEFPRLARGRAGKRPFFMAE